MNFNRYPYRNSQQSLQQNPQQRNFGSDIHEFMDGLGKIAQIMYTSIPIIEFLKIATKYSWKFCEYLGSNALSSLGIIKISHQPEEILEALWNKQPAWKSMAKLSSFAAIGLIIFCLLLSKPELEEEWNKTSEENIQQRPQPEIRSVEDKPYPEEMIDEYNEYPMY